MTMLRLITNMQTSGERVFKSFNEIKKVLKHLLEAVQEANNSNRIRYEAFRALIAVIENSKGAFKLLNTRIAEKKENIDWYKIIGYYMELTNFDYRVHPDTNMAAQMDFLLTVQRRGLMYWNSEDDDKYKAELLKKIEEQEQKAVENNPKKKVIENKKARFELNKTHRVLDQVK